MRFVRGLLFTPVVILISPVLLVLGVIILAAETKSGPLRSLFADEVRAYGIGIGFGRFMQKVFVPAYKHHVQSFVLGAAGVLVVTVGLRGLGVLPVVIVYLALGLEFTLLVLWAITVYFTEEEEITENGKTLAHMAPPTAGGAGNDKLVASLNALCGQMALLEQRLRMTEARFEQLGALNSSLQDLTVRMNSLVGDQFNLAVKREFEQILAELAKRASENNHPAQ
jgi:hypothetical protein